MLNNDGPLSTCSAQHQPSPPCLHSQDPWPIKKKQLKNLTCHKTAKVLICRSLLLQEVLKVKKKGGGGEGDGPNKQKTTKQTTAKLSSFNMNSFKPFYHSFFCPGI